MKFFKMPYETAARTGWSHTAWFKVADGDIDAVNEIADVCAAPVGTFIGRAAFGTKVGWATITTPIVDVGIAATGVTNDTLLDGVACATANNITQGGTNALNWTVNNTASRFVTIKQLGSGSTATAGEGFLFFSMVDSALLMTDPSSF